MMVRAFLAKAFEKKEFSHLINDNFFVPDL